MTETIWQALIDLWNSQQISADTNPPDRPGPGGQMITAWVRAEKVEALFDALENSQEFRERLRG